MANKQMETEKSNDGALFSASSTTLILSQIIRRWRKEKVERKVAKLFGLILGCCKSAYYC